MDYVKTAPGWKLAKTRRSEFTDESFKSSEKNHVKQYNHHLRNKAGPRENKALGANLGWAYVNWCVWTLDSNCAELLREYHIFRSCRNSDIDNKKRKQHEPDKKGMKKPLKKYLFCLSAWSSYTVVVEELHVHCPPARETVRPHRGKPMFTFTLANFFGSPGENWLHINVVINWQQSKQGIRWPVSPDRIAGSGVDPSRSSTFLKLSADKLLVLKWSQAQVYFWKKFLWNMLRCVTMAPHY